MVPTWVLSDPRWAPWWPHEPCCQGWQDNCFDWIEYHILCYHYTQWHIKTTQLNGTFTDQRERILLCTFTAYSWMIHNMMLFKRICNCQSYDDHHAGELSLCTTWPRWCLHVHGLTVIRTWISNNILSFLWDVITHPGPDFNGGLTKRFSGGSTKPPCNLGHGWVIRLFRLWRSSRHSHLSHGREQQSNCPYFRRAVCIRYSKLVSSTYSQLRLTAFCFTIFCNPDVIINSL